MIRPPALLLGVPIADLGMNEVLGLIDDMVRDGRRSGHTHQIATANVDFLVNALRDARLRRILQHADLCLADGMGVVWGASMLGMPIAERVAGADLVPLLLQVSASTGWRVHVFGSSPETARIARALIAREHPGSKVTIDPGPRILDPTVVDEGVLDSIAEVDADILCVALGNPKQELFIDAHRERLGAPVMIGVGGSLDLFAGERRRAPRWMQRTGTEWVARAVQEPRRLGPRYARDIRVFAPQLVREWRAVRSRRAHPALTVAVGAAGVEVCVGMSIGPAPEHWREAVQHLVDGADLRLVCGASGSINDPALAWLVGLVQLARRRGRRVHWLDDPAPLALALAARGIPASLVGAA